MTVIPSIGGLGPLVPRRSIVSGADPDSVTAGTDEGEAATPDHALAISAGARLRADAPAQSAAPLGEVEAAGAATALAAMVQAFPGQASAVHGGLTPERVLELLA